jgi:hypothetical protein
MLYVTEGARLELLLLPPPPPSQIEECGDSYDATAEKKTKSGRRLAFELFKGCAQPQYLAVTTAAL